MDYSKDRLISMFIDWCNNYSTVERFASDYGIDTQTAMSCINRGRVLNESEAIDIKFHFSK